MTPHPDIYKSLRLPPGFAAHPSGSPWQAALEAAAAGHAPGTLLHGSDASTLDAALILTPDRPVEDSTVLRLGLLAVLDTLAALIAPETAITAIPPGTVAVNGGEVASVTLARGRAEADGTPSWLVLGINIRVAVGLEAPGLTPWLTDLAEEGVDISAPALLESLCRHLLAGVDIWQAEGEAGIARAWQAIQPLQAA